MTTFRLQYLDGIRGIAALYVAAFHCYQMQFFVSSEMDQERMVFFRIFKPLCMGHYAVAVFIVLSGYCLMLPIAQRGGNYSMEEGVLAYFARRLQRIIPPFYAAVLLTMALLPITRAVWGRIFATGIPKMQSLIGSHVQSQLVTQLLSHLCLINNGVPVNDESIVKLASNTPLWSVATESQIYVLFPAILLPILRHLGAWVAVSFGVGLGVVLSLSFDGRYQLACPWMFGVFSIGVLGALITKSQEDIYIKLRQRVPWDYLGGMIVIAFLAIGVFNLGLYRRHPVIVDTCLGVGIMCVLVAMSLGANQAKGGFVQMLARMLSSRFCKGLGEISYSLYLIHYPLLVLLQGVIIYFCSSLIMVDYIMLLPAMGLVTGAAYLFSRTFEKRVRKHNLTNPI